MKNSIIYEIFVRNHSKEGSFSQIKKDIPRIKKMGVDIVWLMPIHPIGVIDRKGAEGSPYSIRDYNVIDESLGDEKSLKELITTVHDHNMKIIIDVVYNHTSKDSSLIKSHPEWFLKDSSGNIIQKWPEWSDITDLDFKNIPLWENLIDSLRKWRSLGIDGFRCDVASLVPLKFWLKAKESLPEDTIWLAESTHRSFLKIHRRNGYIGESDAELHQAFQITYEYDGFEYLEKSNFSKKGIEQYINHLDIQETMLPRGALKLRFIENHDQPRAASRFKNKEQLLAWTHLYLLLDGVPLIYAGQEYGISHLPNLFEKDVIPWESGDHDFNHKFLEIIKLSKGVKKDCTHCDAEYIDDSVVKIKWTGAKVVHEFIINLSEKQQLFSSPLKLTDSRKLESVDPFSVTSAVSTSKKTF